MTNTFTTKKISPLTLGETLKKKREELRFDLKRVSRKTGIQIKYLKALEQNDFPHLPPPVYVKGFLKCYARVLRLDPDKILRIHEREKEIENNLRRNDFNTFSSKLKPPKIIITPKKIISGFIILGVILSVIYIIVQISSFSRVPTLVIDYPKENLVINSNHLQVVGKTDPEVQIFINDQSVFVDELGRFKEDLELQEGINTLRIKAENSRGGEKVLVRQVRAVFTRKVAGTNKSDLSRSTEKNIGIDLEIRAYPNQIWIHVEEDGRLAFEGIILTGNSKKFLGKHIITLSTGNAGSTIVKFNGKDLGKLGRDGEVIKNLEFKAE